MGIKQARLHTILGILYDMGYGKRLGWNNFRPNGMCTKLYLQKRPILQIKIGNFFSFSGDWRGKFHTKIK